MDYGKVALALAAQGKKSANTATLSSVNAQIAASAKGFKIGIGNKAAFAISYDDSLNAVKETFVAIHRTKGFPWSQAILADPTYTHNNNVTYDEAYKYSRNYGMEVWTHGWGHGTPFTLGDLQRDIVTARDTIETNYKVKSQGFVQPGTNPSGMWNNLGSTKDVANLNSDAGRLLKENHVHYSGYIGTTTRRIPTGNVYGAARYTITAVPAGKTSAQHRADVIAAIDLAVANKASIAFLVHPHWIDLTNSGSIATYMNLSDYVLILDRLSFHVDANAAEVLTMSALGYVDHSTERVDLAAENGLTFAGVSQATPGFWSQTTVWSDKTFGTSATWGIPSFTQDNTLDVSGANNLQGQINNLYDFAGEAFELRFKVRSTTAQTQRIKVQLTGSAGVATFLDIQAGAGNPALWGEYYAATGQGSNVRIPFILPKDTTFLKIALGRGNGAAGTGNGLEWADFKIVKI